MVVTKGKQLEDDPVVVQLLTGTTLTGRRSTPTDAYSLYSVGSHVDIQSFSKVKVAMICDNQQVKTSSSKSIENDTQTMDGTL